LTVITRVSIKAGVFAEVVVFPTSTTLTVSVLGPATTVVAPLSQLSVVAAGVQVIQAGMVGVVIVYPAPSPPVKVYNGGD
jgi:hypothetical protein